MKFAGRKMCMSFPRVGGGEPYKGVMAWVRHMFSPRGRG